MVHCWESISKDFNRYVQKIRRLHNSPIQYLRCVEAHADGYPHLHCILQFPSVQTVNHGQYFDKLLHSKWKQLWSFGLSDFKVFRSKQSPILYMMKYISKSTNTHKTLWKKLLIAQTSTPQVVHDVPTETKDASPDQIKYALTLLKCKEFKIKQLSWSRLFQLPLCRWQDEQLKIVRVPDIALLNARTTTQKSL